MLYGSETWTLLKEDKNRLQAFEMGIWRRMMKVSWKEHRPNEDILSMVQHKKIQVSTISNRQKNWIGHILNETHL